MHQMEALHGLLADVFLSEVQRCHAAGECPPPQLLSQIIKWLKDNGIDQPARASGVDRLLGQFPNMDALESGLVVPITRAKKE